MSKIIVPGASRAPIIGRTRANPISILISMPLNSAIQKEPHDAWARLLAYMAANPRYILSDMHASGAYIDHNRDRIAQRAISENTDYVLMIDSDMKYPHTVADTLISRDKDIIGCVYYTPSWDTKTGTLTVVRPMLFDYNQKTQQFHPWPKCDKKEPFQIDAIGTGLMLIKTKVFKKLKRPWFFFYERRGEIMGEDLGFCLQCMAKKIEIWVDPTVQTGHVKSYIYSEKDCTIK